MEVANLTIIGGQNTASSESRLLNFVHVQDTTLGQFKTVLSSLIFILETVFQGKGVSGVPHVNVSLNQRLIASSIKRHRALSRHWSNNIRLEMEHLWTGASHWMQSRNLV